MIFLSRNISMEKNMEFAFCVSYKLVLLRLLLFDIPFRNIFRLKSLKKILIHCWHKLYVNEQAKVTKPLQKNQLIAVVFPRGFHISNI